MDSLWSQTQASFNWKLNTVTSSGVLYGRSISFKEINTTCQKIKEHVRLLGTGAKTISIIEPFSGLGLIFAAFLPIYSGAEVLFISPGWAEVRISKIIETFKKYEIIFMQDSLIDAMMHTPSSDLPMLSLEEIKIITIVYNSTVCGFKFNCFRECMDIFGVAPSKIMTIVTSNFLPVITMPIDPSKLVYDFTRVMYLGEFKIWKIYVGAISWEETLLK